MVGSLNMNVRAHMLKVWRMFIDRDLLTEHTFISEITLSFHFYYSTRKRSVRDESSAVRGEERVR